MSKIMKLFSPIVFVGFLVLTVQTEAYALTQRGLATDASRHAYDHIPGLCDAEDREADCVT